MLAAIKVALDRYLEIKPLALPLGEHEVIGRVVEVQRGSFLVMTSEKYVSCAVGGSFLFNTATARDLPTVGDYVVVKASGEQGLVSRLLPRVTLLSRVAPGNSMEQQLLAANIDRVLITSSLTAELNLRRLERYLLIAWESGAVPMVVLTKSDLCLDVPEKLNVVSQIAMGAQVIAVSGSDQVSIEALRTAIGANQTVVLVGSSGVGKSTLINCLSASAAQKTQEVRGVDSKGRHTTTCRSMMEADGGLLIIDTPGMRELQIHGNDEAVDHTFEDVLELFSGCRFGDCRHEKEPGCRVQEAITSGKLEPGRLISFQKLEKERQFARRKSDKGYSASERKKWKARSKQMRQIRKVDGW